MKPQEREAAILEEIKHKLLSEGYEVVIHPNSLLVPEFLGKFRPDAVAFRSDKNLVVEVATRGTASERRLKHIQEVIGAQDNWELRLIWSAPGQTSRALQRATVEAVQNAVEENRKLLIDGHYGASFLLSWSALEALGRMLLPSALARPQSPARLVDQLAQRGFLPPKEADDLRTLISKRNRLTHGDLRTDIKKKDVDSLLKILELLISEAVTFKGREIE